MLEIATTWDGGVPVLTIGHTYPAIASCMNSMLTSAKMATIMREGRGIFIYSKSTYALNASTELIFPTLFAAHGNWNYVK